MIAEKDSIALAGNITPDESIRMTIAADAADHLMDVMTNLYGDREMAVLREVTTNALDAHVAAGVTRPVEVHTPTELASVLTIKDYGVGLSVEDIRNIFSQYGASTKRETNDQVGSLGLGCKSPLAYADAFTLIAVKDGIKATVSVRRAEEGGGTMDVVSTEPTTEHNGVTVQVPAKRYSGFAAKAKDLFSYWQPGTVLLDGEAPEVIDGLAVTDRLLLVQGGDDKIVMGNVPYPVTWPNLRVGWGYGLVATVPIGAVAFQPSREGLRDTQRTTDVIESLEAEYLANIDKAIQTLVRQAPTAREALAVARRWHDKRRDTSSPLTWGGRPMPDTFKAPDGTRFTITERSTGWGMSRSSRVAEFNADYVLNALFVTGYDAANFSISHKKKLNAYVEQQGLDVRHYVLSPAGLPGAADLFDPAKVVKWETVAAIKLERAKSSVGPSYNSRPKGSYKAVVNGTRTDKLEAKDIDTSKPVLWLNTTTSNHLVPQIRQIIGDEKITLALLPVTRVDKFKRDFPTAQHALAFLKDRYEAIKLTDADARYAGIVERYARSPCLRRLRPDQVRDPALKRAVNIHAGDVKEPAVLATLRKYDRLLGSMGVESRLKPVTDGLISYPLLTHVPSYGNVQADHIIQYVNAVYAAETKEV